MGFSKTLIFILLFIFAIILPLQGRRAEFDDDAKKTLLQSQLKTDEFEQPQSQRQRMRDARECSNEEFSCRKRAFLRCIHYTQVCDGINDCGDNLDEQNCHENAKHMHEERTVLAWEQESDRTSSDDDIFAHRSSSAMRKSQSKNAKNRNLIDETKRKAFRAQAFQPKPVDGNNFNRFWNRHRDRDFYNVMHICYNKTTSNLFAEESSNRPPCGEGEKIVATGLYRNAVNETGWGLLEVETFADFEPEIQAYAAGLVEGLLTRLQIQYHFENIVADMCANCTEYCDRLVEYLDTNLRWIRDEVLSQPRSDLYWRHVNLTYTQLTGIFDGYNSSSNSSHYLPRVSFNVNDILMLQISGDLIDLEKALNKTPNFNAAGGPTAGHCSAFVKFTDDGKDLLAAHVSMSGFNSMNRIMKLYKFAYDSKEVPGRVVAFSGYPAALASQDDYTLTSAGLLSIETTIAVFDNSRYLLVKPQEQLLCWVRSYIANLLARSSEEWVRMFARYNSGTYNNQWTVVDYKKFKPGQPLPSNDLIWVLEQIPGRTAVRDVTWFLRKYTYWPSYNIPYIDEISQDSGYFTKGLENNWWRWGFSPRARIFNRDHSKVRDINTLEELMRYNDYKHDEYSRCVCDPPYTAEGGISTRGDVNPKNGTYEVPQMGHRNHGAIDYKGTDFAHFQKLQIHVVGGPIYGGKSNIPAFNWANNADFGVKHVGQPLVWKFEHFVTEWNTPVDVAAIFIES